MSTPILDNIETNRTRIGAKDPKSQDDLDYLKDTLILLKALAVESSGRYGGGREYMEAALDAASEYSKDLPLEFVQGEV